MSGTRRWTTWLALGILVLALGGAFLSSRPHGRPAVGSLAPDFSLPELGGGKRLQLSDLRGRVVLINFWTTWCPPCREETPALVAFEERYARQVMVLGVDVAETAETVQAYVRDSGIDYPVLLDRDKAVSGAYGLTGYPESWFVGPDGRLRAFASGPMSFEQMQSLAARALGRPLDAEGVGPVRPGDRLVALARAADGGLVVVTERGSWERAGAGWRTVKGVLPGQGGGGAPEAVSEDGRWRVRWQPGQGLLVGGPGGRMLPFATDLPGDLAVTALAVESDPRGRLARIWLGAGATLLTVDPEGRSRTVSGFERRAGALLPLSPGRVLVASDRGLWLADAASARAEAAGAPARSFAGLARAAGFLWAGAPNGDLYRSADGLHWEWAP
ncbi:MAG: TlpA disulfide reductase family protein [Bacillota bacterium]|nr:TlpA disulfide reductase family protein [Bacillota bacterium]